MAKPRTYRVVVRVVTRGERWKWDEAEGMAGAKTAEVKDVIKVPLQTRMEVKSLLKRKFSYCV